MIDFSRVPRPFNRNDIEGGRATGNPSLGEIAVGVLVDSGDQIILDIPSLTGGTGNTSNVGVIIAGASAGTS